MSVSGQVAPHGPGDQLVGEVLPHQLPRQQLLQLAAVSWPPARAAALHLDTGLLISRIFSWVSPHLQARQLLDPLVERVARLPARVLGLAPGVAQPGAGFGLHPGQQQQGAGEDGGDLGWQPHPASVTSGILIVTTAALSLASGLLHYRNSGSKVGHQLAMF